VSAGARRATAQLLQELLTRPGPYRNRWQAQVARAPREGISQTAVARVLDEHKNVSSGDAARSPHKDLVSRAFRGDVLTAQTVALFVAAFGIDEAHAAQLSALLSGSSDAPRAVRGRAARSLTAAVGAQPRAFRTLVLHEEHRLGPDGLPAEHRTTQLLQALDDGVNAYPYRYDATTASVVALRGARVGSTTVLPSGLAAVELQLPRALGKGETASLSYLTRFAYPEPPPPQFRRAVLHRAENLELRITFHPSRLPRRVWWASWDALDALPSERQVVQLDVEHSAHRYLSALEEAIVGYTWAW
jgi:hypothetical protein